MSFIENLLASNGIQGAQVVTGKDADELLSNLAEAIRKVDQPEPERGMDLSFITPRKAMEFSMSSAILAKEEHLRGPQHEDCSKQASEAAFYWQMAAERLIEVAAFERHESGKVASLSTGELLRELRDRFASDGPLENSPAWNDINMMLEQLDKTSLDFRRSSGSGTEDDSVV